MPHIIVKLYPGRTKEQKLRLAEEITKDVAAIAICEKDAVSVSFQEIEPEKWVEEVYIPDILNNEANLYKKPGHNPL